MVNDQPFTITPDVSADEGSFEHENSYIGSEDVDNRFFDESHIFSFEEQLQDFPSLPPIINETKVLNWC